MFLFRVAHSWDVLKGHIKCGDEAHMDGLKPVTCSPNKALQEQHRWTIALHGYSFHKVSFKTPLTLMRNACVEVEKVTLSNTGASFDWKDVFG